MEKKYHIANNKRDLGNSYMGESENFGDYIGQYGTKKVVYRNDDGEVKVSSQPIVNLKQDFLGLSPEIKKLRKKYRPLKKSMMRESDAYCNGKVY